MNGAAVMIAGTQVFEVDQDDFASRHGYIAIRGETADAIVNRRRGGRVVEINELVRAEIRIEGYAQESAFAGGVYG